MKDINVVVMDVGSIQSPTPTRRRMLGHDAHNDLAAWTESEQLAYGPAYKAMTDPNANTVVAVRRRRPVVVVVAVGEVRSARRTGSVQNSRRARAHVAGGAGGICRRGFRAHLGLVATGLLISPDSVSVVANHHRRRSRRRRQMHVSTRSFFNLEGYYALSMIRRSGFVQPEC